MEGAIGDGAVEGYNAQFTWTAFFCCLTAASGGALFGYDNGVSFAPDQLAQPDASSNVLAGSLSS